MITITQNEKNSFYSKLPDRFDMVIGENKIIRQRHVGKKKIWMGNEAMRLFRQDEIITLVIKDDKLYVKFDDS